MEALKEILKCTFNDSQSIKKLDERVDFTKRILPNGSKI